MAKKKTAKTTTAKKAAPKKEAPKKAAPKVESAQVGTDDSKAVSQSTDRVKFEYSKDYRRKGEKRITIKKGTVKTCSRNTAEILEKKGLGKIVK